MKKIKKIIVFLLPLYCLMILSIFMVFRILPDDDKAVGFNFFCQNVVIAGEDNTKQSKLDNSICMHKRFSKVQFFYIDGLPLYIADVMNDLYKDEMISLSINNPGLSDSGPFYRNFQTGKMNFFYSGKLENIDNLFLQMKHAGQKVLGTGVGYPIMTMTDDKIFDSTVRSENGQNWMNPQYRFYDMRRVQKNIPKDIIEDYNSKVPKSRQEIKEMVKKIMLKEYKKIDARQSEQYNNYELYSKNQSIFTYTAHTDEIGHSFSAHSIEAQYTYGLQLANAKSFYDDYVKSAEKEDLQFVIMSDHGTYNYPYELELTNHGYRDSENRAFAYFLSPNFKNQTLYHNKEIHVSQLAGYTSMFQKNISIPVLSTHSSLPRFEGSMAEKILMLRSREVQVSKLLFGNYDLPLSKTESPFYKFDVEKDQTYYEKLKNSEDIEVFNKVIQNYSDYIKIHESKIPMFYQKLYSVNLVKTFVISIPLIVWAQIQLYKSCITNLSIFLKKKNISINIRSVRIRQMTLNHGYERMRLSFIKCYRLQQLQIIIFFTGAFHINRWFSSDLFKTSNYLIMYLAICIVMMIMYMSRMKKLDITIIHCKRVLIISMFFQVISIFMNILNDVLSNCKHIVQNHRILILNIQTTSLEILLIAKYQYGVIKEILKSSFLNKNLEKIPIMAIAALFGYSSYLIVNYEYWISFREIIKPSYEMMNYSWLFYQTIFYQFLLSFLIPEKAANKYRFSLVVVVLFWFNNFYFRLIMFFCVVCFEYIMKYYYKIEDAITKSQYERSFIANAWYLQAIILFFINFGSSDTNVNVRAAYRGTSEQIGVNYLQSGIIFQVTKWSLEILTITFFYFRFVSYEFTDNLSDQSPKIFRYLTMKTFQPYCKNQIILGMLLFIYELVSSFNFDQELRAHVITISFYSIVIIANFSCLLLYCIKFLISKLFVLISINKPQVDRMEEVEKRSDRESFDDIADGIDIEMTTNKLGRKSSVNSI